MWVYVIESFRFPAERRVGVARDPLRSLAAHNAGAVAGSAPGAPWSIVALFRFEEAPAAAAFARLLAGGGPIQEDPDADG